MKRMVTASPLSFLPKAREEAANSRLTARAIEKFLIVLQFAFGRHDNLVHPRGNASFGLCFQLLLPFFVGEPLFADGALELAIAEHGAARQVAFAGDIDSHVNLIGGTRGGVEDGLVRVVVAVGGS